MAVSESKLRENYRRLPDDKLLRIATEDAAKLRPEALTLLREELRTRGLAAKAERAIAAQFRVLSADEVMEYCALLRALPCPVCHSSTQLLNATMTSKVLSFVVMTTEKKQFFVACPRCLDKLSRDADIYTASLGWWGFPGGVISTVRALLFNRKMAKMHHWVRPNDLLQSFVVQNISRIEAGLDDPDSLQLLIKQPAGNA